MLDTIKCTLQVDIDNLIEVFFFHTEHDIISCNTCIVYEDINSAILLQCELDKSLCLCKISYICLISNCLSAGFLDLCYETVCTLL